MVQTAQIELSINSNATRSQILINAYVTGHLRDMFYDPKTQFINLADWQSGWKSPLNNIQTRLKKGKEYRSVGNELSIKDNIKALKYKSCLGFCTCQKKYVKFTDSTHIIYWPTNIAKKAANYWNKSFYICQY